MHFFNASRKLLKFHDRMTRLKSLLLFFLSVQFLLAENDLCSDGGKAGPFSVKKKIK